MSEEEIQGLKNKNKELLDELKDLKNQMKSFEGLDIKALQDSAAELDKLKKQQMEEEGEYKKLYETQKDAHQKEIKKYQSEIDTLKSSANGLTKELGVSNALSNITLIPELADVARKTIMSEAGVDKDGNVVVGDKAVSEYVKEWAETPVGKHFIMNDNSGGGGPGGGDDTKFVTEEKYFDPKSKEFNRTEQAKFTKANPEKAQEFRAKYAETE